MTIFAALFALGVHDELITYGVAKFGSNACLDSDDTHNVHVDTAEKFREPFYDHAAWDSIHWRENQEVTGALWSSADTTATWGLDTADVIYLHTHGSHTATHTTLYMGKAECGMDTNKDIVLGDGDLDIAVIKACQSADYDVWAAGHYWDMIAGDQFRMWNGFHGNSSCGTFVKWYVKDYSKHSFSEGVGENWIDEAYSSVGDDDCPVSIVFGSSASVRENFFDHAGWLDRKDTGNKTGSTIFYVAGCHPEKGSKLPN